MDLPVDKVRILKEQSREKQWHLICDQQAMTCNVSPAEYLTKLRCFLDPKTMKKNKKTLGDETSTELLKHIAISLRTNSVDWVINFVDPPNNGLDLIIEYMRSLLPDDVDYTAATTSAADGSNSLFRRAPVASGKKQKNAGDSDDDVHMCIMALRGIMNNKHGFQLAFEHKDVIYCIVRSILHQSLRTKTLVVQLLCGMCHVNGGQEKINAAFDQFCLDFKEPRRFHILVHFITNQQEFHIEFLSSVVLFLETFTNVEDFNYKAHLQYELKLAGFDDFIEKAVSCESEELRARAISYQNGMIDANQLHNEAVQIPKLQENVEIYKSKLSQAKERVQEVEAKWITDKAALDARLLELVKEREKMEVEFEMQKGTWTRTMDEKDRTAREKQTRLEQRIQELESMQKTMQGKNQLFFSHVILQTMVVNNKSQLFSGLQVQNIAPSSTAVKSPPTPPPEPGPHRAAKQPSPVAKTISEESAPANSSPASSSSASKAPPIAPPPPPPLSQLTANLPTSNHSNGPIKPPPPASGIPPPPPANLLTGNRAVPPPPPIGIFNAPSNDLKPEKKIYQTKNKLPQLNWTSMQATQAKNTVFAELNDEKIIEKLDFSKLEEMFKIGATSQAGNDSLLAAGDHSQGGQVSPASSTSSNPTAKKNTLMDAKRLQNVAITKRKVAMDSKHIMAAVHQLDLSALSAEKVDILTRILPTEDEKKQYAEHADLESLGDEDRFLAALCSIERLEHKLGVMRVMADFDDTLTLLSPQFTHVTAASKCAREAKHFHKVLEVILAYGNYMNSGKRGGVFGFKLSSLDSLAILKAPSDRSLTLLHVIVESIEQKFPELLAFPAELKFIDKAAGVQWDSLSTDLRDMENGMAMAQKERELKAEGCPQSLIDFLEQHKDKLEQLKQSSQLATKTFESCVEFYGESVKTAQPNVFFSKLTQFVNNFKKCKAENDQRKLIEKRQKEEAERRMQTAATNGARNEMLLELAERMSGADARKRKSKIDSQQIGHGDFEKIMNDLKHSVPTPPRRKVSSSPSPAPRAANPPPVAPKTRTTAVNRDRHA
ncbi:hypothetical protein WR25_10815 [Diploscapter pachys]|uniref:FH2 domain-containing protein n=1 Tax=Diploscapter pachys TaxID=2018661 RepID=A0A2A2JBR0_9BILA|nr:hypothetical protein WR25_10815 [Diploscapter pachys]